MHNPHDASLWRFYTEDQENELNYKIKAKRTAHPVTGMTERWKE